MEGEGVSSFLLSLDCSLFPQIIHPPLMARHLRLTRLFNTVQHVNACAGTYPYAQDKRARKEPKAGDAARRGSALLMLGAGSPPWLFLDDVGKATRISRVLCQDSFTAPVHLWPPLQNRPAVTHRGLYISSLLPCTNMTGSNVSPLKVGILNPVAQILATVTQDCAWLP